jgi:hypothetical protein
MTEVEDEGGSRNRAVSARLTDKNNVGDCRLINSENVGKLTVEGSEPLVKGAGGPKGGCVGLGEGTKVTSVGCVEVCIIE